MAFVRSTGFSGLGRSYTSHFCASDFFAADLRRRSTRGRGKRLVVPAAASSAVAVVMVAVVAAWCVVAANGQQKEERLIGYREADLNSQPRTRGDLDLSAEATTGNIWVERISWEPRAFLFHNFLTPKECLYLIHKAAPKMQKSKVVDSTTGGPTDSKVRTSTGAFLRRGEDNIVARIEKRIAEYTHVPVEHGEAIHVLHYQNGQEYQAHYDYFHDKLNINNGGQRIATMLMYLSDVEEGGETKFPAGDMPEGFPKEGWSKCAEGTLAVKPKRGDALLFWSLKPDATLDPKSLHAGCPVIRGNKWSATKWMRVQARQGD